MKQADIRELVGELIVAGFDGLTLNEHAKKLIDEHRVKNVILFKRNVDSIDQVTELNAELQHFAAMRGHDVPLIICTDQENGVVRRLAPGLPGLPGNMAVAATGNPDNAYEIGRMTARQLLSMGVNMNLAPVLDVNNNPDNPVIGVRSYGEDAHRVAEFGTSMIKGLQESGVIACGKHFPGHGDTSVDSHLALPEIGHSLARLEQIELPPFRRAIEADIDVIMTAHVVFSSIEPRHIPATLSHVVLTRFLREELAFKGVITTDCLEMNAISETIGVGEGAVQALAAGADILMISHRLDRQDAAIAAVVQAVLDGRVEESRLVDAATRVRNLRRKRLTGATGASPSCDSLMQDSIRLQGRVSAQAVTIVANEVGLLPVNPAQIGRIDLLVEGHLPKMMAADHKVTHAWLTDSLQKTFPDSEIRLHTMKDHLLETVTFEGSDLIIVGVNGKSNERSTSILKLLEDDLPVVVIALQSPYDLNRFTCAKTKMAIYEYTPWMVEAGVRALVDMIETETGRLPVNIG